MFQKQQQHPGITCATIWSFRWNKNVIFWNAVLFWSLLARSTRDLTVRIAGGCQLSVLYRYSTLPFAIHASLYDVTSFVFSNRTPFQLFKNQCLFRQITWPCVAAKLFVIDVAEREPSITKVTIVSHITIQDFSTNTQELCTFSLVLLQIVLCAFYFTTFNKLHKQCKEKSQLMFSRKRVSDFSVSCLQFPLINHSGRWRWWHIKQIKWYPSDDACERRAQNTCNLSKPRSKVKKLLATLELCVYESWSLIRIICCRRFSKIVSIFGTFLYFLLPFKHFFNLLILQK